MSDEWFRGVDYDKLPSSASPSDPRKDPKASFRFHLKNQIRGTK